MITPTPAGGNHFLPDARCGLIIAPVSRRIFAPNLHTGPLHLSEAEAHHVRNVLRLAAGATVELFDAAGRIAGATVSTCDRNGVMVNVGEIAQSPPTIAIEIACALPKGERAEWLIEKLSEIGTTRFIPLVTERTVVVPKGDGKLERFRRIAVEAAKQSQRVGVMLIEGPTSLGAVLTAGFSGARYTLSTQGDARPLIEQVGRSPAQPVQLLIGPEGGWSQRELDAAQAAGLTTVSLTTTILRVETAAVAAAAIVAATHASAHTASKKG